MNRTKAIAGACGLVAVLLLTGCGGSSISDATISGTVTGLASGVSVILVDNGGDAQTVSANGGFTFDGKIAPNNGYSVSVSKQPTGQTCEVTNGSGVIEFSGNDVGNVAVTCNNDVTVGGTVTGLAAGASVTLENNFNSGDTVAVGNGSFKFPVLQALGDQYNVTVLSQPTNGQVCTTLSSPGGSTNTGQGGVTSWANVTSVIVTCQ